MPKFEIELEKKEFGITMESASSQRLPNGPDTDTQDIERISYGLIIIQANSPEEAMEIVRQNQCEPDEIFNTSEPTPKTNKEILWTGNEIRPIKAIEI